MAVASPTLPPAAAPSLKGSPISNIQNGGPETSLRRQILAGMAGDSRSLPSLLLWNDAGLKLFKELTQQPCYYPTHKEVQILRESADHIVQQIPDDSLLIELGCGSLCKTSVILSAFERQKRRVSYYALDVSRGELTDGLDGLWPLFRDSPYIQVQGLWGSYEDGINWLARAASVASTGSQAVTFLWMGNSIANLTFSDASSLLKGFVDACAGFQLTCQFIVSLDNGAEVPRILGAYDTSRYPFRSFVLNGLKNANEILGQDVFVPENWSCSRIFRPEKRTLDIYYEALRDMECCYEGVSWAVGQGELVHAVHSGKWATEDLADICSRVGLQVANVWQLGDKSYSFFALRPEV